MFSRFSRLASLAAVVSALSAVACTASTVDPSHGQKSSADNAGAAGGDGTDGTDGAGDDTGAPADSDPGAGDDAKGDAGPAKPAGCDGVAGSNKVVDACGVCGGDGSSCACPPLTLHHDETFSTSQDEKLYVEVTLPEGKKGDTKSWLDGSYFQYVNPICGRITWSNLKLTCTGGKWTLDPSATFTTDNACGESNATQPGLTTGVDFF